MDSTRTSWRERENSLMLGAPLVLIPAIVVLPTVAFLIYRPAFNYAPVVGGLLLIVYGISEVIGIRKLADCVQLEFDVISFLAWGTVVILLVIVACVGVLLVGLVFRG